MKLTVIRPAIYTVALRVGTRLPYSSSPSGVLRSYSEGQRPLDVLLVDDDPFAVQIMQHVLGRSEAGENVHVLTNSEQALELVSELGSKESATLPRLILLDYHMPNVSGLDVLKAVRSNQAMKSIPVVMMSGVEDGDQRSKSIAAGASDFFVKPINFDEFEKLLDVVRTFLQHEQPAHNINLG